MSPNGFWYTLVIFTACVFLAGRADAYIGPGGGLSAIGAFVALVAGVFVAIFGFVWYPVKRLLKRRRSKSVREDPGA